MTIAIIAAMQPELQYLHQHLTDSTTETFHNFKFQCGYLKGKRVVLVQSGIGKVAASIASTIVIDKFSPDAVINTGSAGGLDDTGEVGDVIIGEELRHHDVDVTPFGFEYGQVFDMPAAYFSDAKLISAANKALKEEQQVNSSKGLIVTGDIFAHDQAVVGSIQSNFPLAKAIEMEGAAIAQTCYTLETPFLVTRALSDIAGKSSHMSFEQFLPLASKRSAAMVMRILEQI